VKVTSGSIADLFNFIDRMPFLARTFISYTLKYNYLFIYSVMQNVLTLLISMHSKDIEDIKIQDVDRSIASDQVEELSEEFYTQPLVLAHGRFAMTRQTLVRYLMTRA